MAQFSRYYTYIEPVMKSPKSQAYTTLILSLFAIAFFSIFAIRPTILTILNLHQQIAQATDTDKQLSQKIAALIQAQAVLDSIGDKKNLLNQALPPTPTIALLLQTLETVASDNKVTLGVVQLKSINLAGEEPRSIASNSSTLAAETQVASIPGSQTVTTTPAAAITTIGLTFSIHGDQAAINAYLHELAGKRRIIVIDQLRLVKNVKDGTYTADLNARTFEHSTQ